MEVLCPIEPPALLGNRDTTTSVNMHLVHPIAVIGPQPSVADGTLIYLAEDSGWGQSEEREENGGAIIRVQTPAKARIGRYQMNVETSLKEGPLSLRGFELGDVFVIFNAWNPDDSVFLDDEEKRREYVLNEEGLLYMGSHDYIYPINWKFAQFADGVLEASLDVLDNSHEALTNPVEDAIKRDDPVYICRIVSAMINSNDDCGVVLGRWNGDYSGGVRPLDWTGSEEILRTWRLTGYEPVPYGQCWVYAAVACTVLRCLGIPARCVTNYLSAHDGDKNLTYDRYYREGELELLKDQQRDSIWSFHVWVEAWMAREDLPQDYNGWQVVDPTPQERSEGVYLCGPAPVLAVKRGEISLPYETAFVFAEVNADVVNWVRMADGSLHRANCFTNYIGKSISSKSVTSDEREDITHLYKFPEGSHEEREAYARAGMALRREESHQKMPELAVRLRISRSAFVGSSLDVHTVVRNKGHQRMVLELTSVARAVTYTGQCGVECCKHSCEMVVEPGEVSRETMRMKYEDYAGHLTDLNLIRVTSLLKEKEFGELFLEERHITMEIPKLEVMIIGEPIVGREIKAEMSFTNPLPVTVTRGKFHLEGEGLSEMQIHPSSPTDIESGEAATATATFTPSLSGIRFLFVKFECNRIKDVQKKSRVIVQSN
uniref:protein-glutamine gamma-glutamyltransferase n=2 Tax=Eptatretus burgeri TaxID=7764 RepID=A0A8C4QHE4_EPTBU